MGLESVIPVIALIIGFFLSQIGEMFNRRRERRLLAGKVTSELLQIRHELLVRQRMMSIPNHLRETHISEEEWEQITDRDWSLYTEHVENGMTVLKSVSDNYNEALRELSGVAPLLSFRLRDKDRIPAYLSWCRQRLQTDYSFGHQSLLVVEARLTQELLESVDEACTQVARVHGLRTLRKVRKYLSSRKDNDIDAFEQFDKIITDLKPLLQPGTQSPMPPNQSPGSP